MNKEELIMVGDRVLIEADSAVERTDTGLYLPQGVREKEKVQAGTIIKTGPGYPVADLQSLEAEPWQTEKHESKYLPLQAKVGDYCIFLRSSGIEIEFQSRKYIVVPHSAILVLVRNQ